MEQGFKDTAIRIKGGSIKDGVFCSKKGGNREGDGGWFRV